MAKLNKECVILFNTKAGVLKMRRGIHYFRQLAQNIDLKADIIATTSQDHMLELIRQAKADGVKKIVVAGGDGTVAAAVQELAYTDVAFGIIPLGTYNNFATAVRIPQDMTSALLALKHGETRYVSLGLANNIYFTEAAGVGLFADALALYGIGHNKNPFLATIAALRVIFSLPTHRVNLTIDGKQFKEKVVMCTASNTYRLGADEVLDVVIIGNLTYKELWPYYQAIRSQIHPSLPKVATIQAKEIKIESVGHVDVHADDHVIGKTPITISIAPRALKVIIEEL
jgi:diacylglycerol kinase (ATP)